LVGGVMFGFAAGVLVSGVGAGAVGVATFGPVVCAGAAVVGGGAGGGGAGAAVRVRCPATHLAQLRIAITGISLLAMKSSLRIRLFPSLKLP
jgi:hypothetical protein